MNSKALHVLESVFRAGANALSGAAADGRS